MIVIPDASVLLKWVLPGDDEQDGDAALSLRAEAVSGSVELVVPQLWLYEVGNTSAFSTLARATTAPGRP